MLCLLNEEFLMRKNNLQREKLKLEVEKLFFLLQVHFPPLEYAKFTARKTRHEVDKVHSLSLQLYAPTHGNSERGKL